MAAGLVGCLCAQDADQAATLVNFGYASRRVFRGVERAGSSAQASGEFSENGFRAGVWANQPFASGTARETDLDAAYTWRTPGGIALELSATGYWFSDVPANGTKHSWESGLMVSLPAVANWIPSVAYFRDFRFDADTAQVAVTRSVALTNLGAFLDFKIFAGASTGENWRPDAPGPRRSDSYGYWGAETNLPFRIGPHSTLIGGLHFSDTVGRSAINGPEGRSARANLGVTFGVNLDF